MHCNSVVLFLRLLGIEYLCCCHVPVCVCVYVLWCMLCMVTFCECVSSVVCRVWHSDKKGTGEDEA